MPKLFLLLLLAAFTDAKRHPGHSKVRPGPPRPPRNASKFFYQSVIGMTRFNCAFPFCPTTALDVCTMDEHYEVGRPHVIATLIPQTTTADMNFLAYSAWDNSTRLHYTLAPRQVAGEDLNQLFVVYIAPNGTSGGQVGATAEVAFPPGLTQAEITYFFTYQGGLYVTFASGALLPLNPSTGKAGNVSLLFPPSANLATTTAAVFDETTGTFWANAVGLGGGYFLHSFDMKTLTAGPVVGPLGPTPTTGANPNNERADTAVATLAVYPPASVDPQRALRLMEMRTSPLFPWIFMAWLDPLSGNSSLIELPSDWYKDWDIDPELFPEQWAGSKRRMWAYDPIDQVAWFKLYDECDQNDDCTEDETIVNLEWFVFLALRALCVCVCVCVCVAPIHRSRS